MNEQQPKKRKFIPFLLRSLGVFLLLLFILVGLLFKSTGFQTFTAQKLATYFSEKTGNKISIDLLSIDWFDEVSLQGVLVLDHHEDTLLYAQSLTLGIDAINFKKAKFELDELSLNEANIELVKYKGEELYNFAVFIEKLGLKSKEKKDSTSIHLLLEGFSVKNSRFRFWDENQEIKEFGVDYSHLSCRNLNVDFKTLSVINDSITGTVKQLSLDERSGFQLKGLTGGLRLNHKELTLNDMLLLSSSSQLRGKLSFLFSEYSDLKEFVKKVKIQSELKSSQLSGNDLSYFVPALEGLKDSVQLAGQVKGKIGRLKLRDFKLAYGEKTFFEGKLDIDGLPDIENAFVFIDVTDFKTSEKDIQRIPLPPFDNVNRIKTPSWFKNLGDISFAGKYTGFSTDFVAYGKFKTRCGSVATDVNFSKNEKGVLDILGKVNTQGFNLKRLLREDELGLLSFSGKLNSKTNKKQFVLDMEGAIPRFDFHGYSYTGIQVDGQLTPREFNGNLSVLDSNLIMDFKGGVNFSKKLQEYKFTARVEKANLHQLHLMDRDSSTMVSFDMDIDLAGNQLRDIFGSLDIKDFDWYEKGEHHHFNTTKIKSIKTPNKELLSINSDWCVARIEGKYDLQELYPSLLNILSRDLPSLIDWKYSKAASKGTNDFRLMFKVTNYALIRDLFTPDLNLVNASFSGTFNDKEQVFRMNFKADTFQVKTTSIEQLKLYAHNQDEQITVDVNSKFIALFDTVGLKTVQLTATSNNNLSNYQLSWNNDAQYKNNGLINGVLGIEHLDSVWTHISRFDLTVEDKLWSMDSLNSLVFTPDIILFDHFKINSKEQLLDIEGLISATQNNRLKIQTKNFKLDNLDRLMDSFNTKLAGSVTGFFQVDGPAKTPVINANVQIEDFQLNGQAFGKVFLKSDYFTSEGRMALDFYIENQSKTLTGNTLKIKGNYYPLQDGKLDLTCSLANLKLQFLERYFEGVFSDFKRGKTSGNLKVKGTIALPEIYGDLRLDQLNLKVDYLNVEYAINAQTLFFDNNKIKFKDFTLRHNTYTKSEAIINGLIQHTGFRDLSYSFDAVRLKDLFCLNTSIDENASYYGTAFVDGLLQLKGDGKNNVISGTVSTVSYEDKLTKGKTELNLPLNDVGELEVSDFINFVDLKNGTKQVNEADSSLDISGLTMDLSFLVHEETKVKIIFDPKVGDEIEVNGEGNVNMKITPEGQFLMSGKYTISQGKYFFTLKNFIGKKLIVEEGGTISWDGDPLNADLDIQTHYQARAKLIDLVSPTVSNYEILAEQYSSRNAVYANLALKGPLMKPDITMSVSLPNGTAQETEFLNTQIVGIDEVNRQAFSLLLTNQFLPVHSGSLAGNVNVGTGIDNGIQFLEGQLNNALGGVFNNLDLGVDYNSKSQSDSLSQDELRLLFGFQYKNLSIKTDYAVNNEAGEIQVEYKLTQELKAKAFRRRTEQTIIDNGSNITQGAGLIFQRTFDNVGELFRRRKKNKK